MALTTEQEKQLASLLQAFQNAKRLSDLPDAGASNPFGLLVEVLDSDGETKKANLAAMLPYLEEQCAYGIEFDTEVSSPACTRVGSMSLHRTLPIQSRMRGCLLDDDGNVVEYLPPLDWSTAVRDGSRGQVMVEIPAHWRRFITDGTKRRVMLSEHPLPGYHHVPRAYVSAYEATIQRSTGKLASVANTAPDYRGGDNNPNHDGTYRSLLGRPATQTSRGGFRNAARLRKPGSTEWNLYTYHIHKAITWLFVVEYSTLNSQAPYNAQPTAEGFRQGGLGPGITEWTDPDWMAHNSRFSTAICGLTDTLGNRTGETGFTLFDEAGQPVKTMTANRYRGIENPFGNIWKYLDGVNAVRDIESGSDSLTFYACDDPAGFADNTTEGYSRRGCIDDPVNSYIKQIIFGVYGDMLPSSTKGAGSNTYFCDSAFVTRQVDAAHLAVWTGGGTSSNQSAGLFSTRAAYIPTEKQFYLGTRLCFIPNE